LSYYLGGDVGAGIAIDATGRIVVTGATAAAKEFLYRID
jgi:hypothetical protein